MLRIFFFNCNNYLNIRNIYVTKSFLFSRRQIPQTSNQANEFIWGYYGRLWQRINLLWHPDCYQQLVSFFWESRVWKLGQLRVTDYDRKAINVRVTLTPFLSDCCIVAPLKRKPQNIRGQIDSNLFTPTRSQRWMWPFWGIVFFGEGCFRISFCQPHRPL